MDACYRSAISKRWEPVELEVWRGLESIEEQVVAADYDEHFILIKEEHMPDGRTKLILKDKESGSIVQRVEE